LCYHWKRDKDSNECKLKSAATISDISECNRCASGNRDAGSPACAIPGAFDSTRPIGQRIPGCSGVEYFGMDYCV